MTGGSPSKLRFEPPWGEVLRVVASPSTRWCFVDGGSPERSLLVPGDGAPAPYDIADRAALVEAILAHVPADKVQTVATLSGERAPVPLPRTDDPEALGLMQYTSGSTGDPKGVMLTHWGLLENVRAMGHAMEATSKDVFVSWLPLYHDMGLIGAWLGCCYFGARLYVMSPISFLVRPATWLWTMHKYRATFSGGPNFAFELCASRIPDEDLKGLDLSSLRFVVNGAEPISPVTSRARNG